MEIRKILLLKGAIWTVAAFAVGQFIRLVSNVVLARLLAPELFGVMQIVYSLRTGVELLSDVGINQNIIYNKNANDPNFYNTAWSLQSIRGIILWLLFSTIALPAARFYQSPILALIIPVAALTNVISGFSSVSRFLLQKRMKYSTLTVFDATVAVAASMVQIILAYFSPTIWALVIGSVAGVAIFSIGTHFVLPEIRHRFVICRQYAIEILSFGKWIFVSSIIYFMSTNFDRLYFAKTIPLQLLGVYGIARSFSELLSGVVLSLGTSVVFPFIALHSDIGHRELRDQLAPIRFRFLLVAALGFSAFAATADLMIGLLYDQRYQAARWMLPVLIIGAWFSILSNINESTLLGLGRPQYSAVANGAKFGFQSIGLMLAVGHFGVVGGVLVVAISDFCRYIPILVGQFRARFSFGRQDLFATLVVFTLSALLEWLRWKWGFGTSFDALAADMSAMPTVPWKF